jgi:Protein of unknown function (DUF1571)
MARMLLCLPLCLLLAPSYPGAAPAPAPLQRRLPTSGATERVYTDIKLDGLPNPGKDLFGFLDGCLKRYNQTVKGFTVNFWKKECIDGKLQPLEIVDVCYRDQPLSIFFSWQQGSRGPTKALYVEGENFNAKGQSQTLALVTFGIVLKRDPDSSDAKKYGRYPMNKFGLRQAMERVVQTWRVADAEKSLHVEYLGLYQVMDAGGCICHTIHRHDFAHPEGDDGVTEVYIFVDVNSLLQVGSVVLGEGGKLLGEYYFRDIQLNPEFAPGQFTPAALKK